MQEKCLREFHQILAQYVKEPITVIKSVEDICLLIEERTCRFFIFHVKTGSDRL